MQREVIEVRTYQMPWGAWYEAGIRGGQVVISGKSAENAAEQAAQLWGPHPVLFYDSRFPAAPTLAVR